MGGPRSQNSVHELKMTGEAEIAFAAIDYGSHPAFCGA
jgi:hypothetical protein